MPSVSSVVKHACGHEGRMTVVGMAPDPARHYLARKALVPCRACLDRIPWRERAAILRLRA